MKPEEFRIILEGAVAGNHADMEAIFELYMPLIENHSYLYGRPDEDLKQYILMHIALNISKFNI